MFLNGIELSNKSDIVIKTEHCEVMSLKKLIDGVSVSRYEYFTGQGWLNIAGFFITADEAYGISKLLNKDNQ